MSVCLYVCPVMSVCLYVCPVMHSDATLLHVFSYNFAEWFGADYPTDLHLKIVFKSVHELRCCSNTSKPECEVLEIACTCHVGWFEFVAVNEVLIQRRYM